MTSIAVAAIATAAAWRFSALRSAGASVDADLERLLQMMAIVKLAMALVGLWLIDRRLGDPIGSSPFLGYLAGGGALAAGPVLIWHPMCAAVGALVFHGGLGLLAVIGWRDREALGAQLERSLRFARRAGRSN